MYPDDGEMTNEVNVTATTPRGRLGNYAMDEADLLDDIEKAMRKLDKAVQEMDAAKNKAAAYAHREKALHEMRRIVSKSKRLEAIDEGAQDASLTVRHEELERAGGLTVRINHTFEVLDQNLAALEKSGDAEHLKGFDEQQKALDEIAAILRKAGKHYPEISVK